MTHCGIACELHDYLEIACLYCYDVKLTLKDGRVMEGKAKDTQVIDKREYLILDRDGQMEAIELIALKKLQVLTANAQFKVVDFD